MNSFRNKVGKGVKTYYDPRSLATSLYGEAAKVTPFDPFSISGKLSSSGFGRNSNF